MCSSMNARSLSRYSCAAGLRAKSMADLPVGGGRWRAGREASVEQASGGESQARDALAGLRHVAVGGGQPLGPLEVEVRVVLPGEADTPVELDHRPSRLLGDLAGLRLGDGRGEFDVRPVR